MSVDYNSLSEEEQIKIVKHDPFKIQYIKDPCLEAQLTAVNKYGYSIQYIKDPCLEAQLTAVNKYGCNIQYIKNACYEVQLSAIQEETNICKYHFELIKKYITFPDLLELLELKILSCKE